MKCAAQASQDSMAMLRPLVCGHLTGDADGLSNEAVLVDVSSLQAWARQRPSLVLHLCVF